MFCLTLHISYLLRMHAHLKQFVIQFLAQRYFNMWVEGQMDYTAT